jgi:diguanylate cyclase (GGDEF)-like protein
MATGSTLPVGALQAWAVRLLVVLALLAPLAAQAEPWPATKLALQYTMADARIDQIIAGSMTEGFDPVLRRAVTVNLKPGQAAWLELSVDLGDEPGALWLDRRPLQVVRVFQRGAGGREVGYLSFDEPGELASAFGGGMALALPAELRGEQVLYLQVTGAGRHTLQPYVASLERVRAFDAGARNLRMLLCLLAVALALAGFLRARSWPESGGRAIALMALLAMVGLMGAGGSWLRWPGFLWLGEKLEALSTTIVLLPIAGLFWATAHFAAADRHSPQLNQVLLWGGFGAALFSLVGTFVPAEMLVWVARGVPWLWALALVLAGLALLLDSRQTKHVPALLVLALLVALGLRYLVSKDILLPGYWQVPALAGGLLLLGASYLALPWWRLVQKDRQMSQRRLEQELTPEQRIAIARKQLLTGLQSGLKNASENDLEWIAYRRLLQGLKPVLAQLSSAVVAMNYHGEDLLMVEPKEAEDRYRSLIAQRGTTLKNLSRSMGPQQVSMDFDGNNGPLPAVQLAVIPLPIEKPGWGVLLIERGKGVVYSEHELDMCAEFASLATTAGDEASAEHEARRLAESDALTGIYNAEAVGQHLKTTHERCHLQRRHLAVLRITVDTLEALRASHGEAAADQCLQVLVAAIKEDLDYGFIFGRSEDAALLVIIPDRNLMHAIAFAEELRDKLATVSIPGQEDEPPSCSMGLSAAMPTENTPVLLLQRVMKATDKARENGAHQLVVIGV